jgi:hypothetical protein
MYKCCRHWRLYSVRKIIVPIRSLSKGKIRERETLYQILTYTRYVYMCMNTEANCQLYFSLSLKKKSNDFTFALSCFEHSARVLWSLLLYASRWYFADSSIYMCLCLVTYIYHEWSNRSYHLTFSLFRFCLKRKNKKR